jgi:hypothetical protein
LADAQTVATAAPVLFTATQEQAAPPSLSSGAGLIVDTGDPGGSHITIIPSYDRLLTALNNDGNATDQANYSGYVSAINEAIGKLESLITNPITITIDFGWGEAGQQGTGEQAVPAGDIGIGAPAVLGAYSWSQIYPALETTFASGSAVQQAALATLSATNPTGGGLFAVGEAQAEALGLNTAVFAGDTEAGYVGISSTIPFSWTETAAISANTFDAVGDLEHEITHAMGRID